MLVFPADARRELGTGFRGMASQPHLRSIKAELEEIGNTVLPKVSDRTNATMEARIPKARVIEVIGASIPAFKHCYEQGLARDPKLAGGVLIEFTIGREGNISKLRVLGTPMDDRAVTRCVEAEFRKLQFPKPNGGEFRASFPLRFSPKPESK